MHRVFLASCLAGFLLLLPGCTWLWGTASNGGATAEEQARAEIREATPVIEAFYAENGTSQDSPRRRSDPRPPSCGRWSC